MNRIFDLVRGVVMVCLLLVSQALMAEIAVIANKGVAVDALTAAQVKALYLGKEKRLPDGSSPELGDQAHDGPVYEEFVSKVLGKTPKKMKRYWAKRVFAGKGVPPKELGDDAAVKAWVSGTPNAIGYISSGAVDDSVKVLLRK